MKLKKAFSTVAAMELDANEVINGAKRANIDTLEVRLGNGGDFMGYTLENMGTVNELLKSNGIKVCDIGAGACYKEYNPALIEKYKAAVDMAAAVGAKGVRLFLGNWYKTRDLVPVHDYDGIVKAIKESCDYAARLGIEVWIETHNEFSKGTVLAKLIADVGRDNLKIIWDIIHPYELAETPEETVAALGDRIAHVHIKDGVPSDDPNMIDYTYTRLGEGTLPIARIVKLLIDNGYEGHFSLEWENAWRAEIQNTYTTLDEILSSFNKFMDNI